MNCYRVGGCVRDRLLGLPTNDIDWVVTGATPADMETAGFKPVGRDFPVFLHPQSKQEYALARSERKSAQRDEPEGVTSLNPRAGVSTRVPSRMTVLQVMIRSS